MKRLLLIAAALLTLSGEAPGASLRHLEYAFAVYPSAQGHRGYYDGTLNVDVLGPAADGGVSVRTDESWYHATRPRQSRLCEVYAEGTVRCDDAPPYPTETEITILPLLGGEVFSAAAPQGISAWRRTFKLRIQKDFYVTSVSMDFKATPAGDGRTLNGSTSTVYKQLYGTRYKILGEGSFVYDPAARVPLVVHDVRVEVPTQYVTDPVAVDLQLVKDSAATPEETAALQSFGPVRFEISDDADDGD